MNPSQIITAALIAQGMTEEDANKTLAAATPAPSSFYTDEELRHAGVGLSGEEIASRVTKWRAESVA